MPPPPAKKARTAVSSSSFLDIKAQIRSVVRLYVSATQFLTPLSLQQTRGRLQQVAPARTAQCHYRRHPPPAEETPCLGSPELGARTQGRTRPGRLRGGHWTGEGPRAGPETPRAQGRHLRKDPVCSLPLLYLRSTVLGLTDPLAHYSKGKTGGLTEAQIDSLLVDFDAQGSDSGDDSAGSDVDESLTVPSRLIEGEDKDAVRSGPSRAGSETQPRPDPGISRPQPDPALPHDPLVEYTDEFGRARMIPRSEVPRGAPFRDPSIPELQYQGDQPVAPAEDSGAFKPGEGPDP